MLINGEAEHEPIAKSMTVSGAARANFAKMQSVADEVERHVFQKMNRDANLRRPDAISAVLVEHPHLYEAAALVAKQGYEQPAEVDEYTHDGTLRSEIHEHIAAVSDGLIRKGADPAYVAETLLRDETYAQMNGIATLELSSLPTAEAVRVLRSDFMPDEYAATLRSLRLG